MSVANKTTPYTRQTLEIFVPTKLINMANMTRQALVWCQNQTWLRPKRLVLFKSVHIGICNKAGILFQLF